MIVLKNDGMTALSFARSRFLRLYPSYWIAVALGAIVIGATPSVALINATMIQRFIGVPDVVGVFWTLQIELIFYIIVFVLIVFGKIRNPSYPLIAALFFTVLSLLLSAVRFYLDKKAPVAPALGLIIIFTSFTYYNHYEQGYLTKRQMTAFLLFICIALAISFNLAYAKNWGYQEHPAKFIISYATGIGLFLIFKKKNLNAYPLTWLGGISYSLYLVHVPIQQIVRNFFGSISQWGYQFLIFALAIFVAYIVNRLIEKPFYKSRIYRKYL